MRVIAFLAVAAAVLPAPAWAMCGCFIPPPRNQEIQIVNQASQVVMVRDGDKTVITMSNDFKGDVEEFAIVIPVPTFIEREQIHVGEPGFFTPLDRWSAPKLIEPLDDPCNRMIAMGEASGMDRKAGASAPSAADSGGRAQPVTVEAEYTVGEYEIVILSATQSDALEKWLNENGYKVPKAAASVFKTYVKQKMRFFVAKANLSETRKQDGFTFLRPLQLAYETPKFMLPIRLGMVNSDGPQELTIYALTRKGRVETTNYRTTRLPTGMTLPVFVKENPTGFYKAMFREQVRKEDMRTVFLEFAGPLNGLGAQFQRFDDDGSGLKRRGGMPNPNPQVIGGSAEPTDAELRKVGVFWATKRDPSGARPVYLTRLHLRYDDAHFPEDLVFQETKDTAGFQATFRLLPSWSKTATCLDEAQRKQTYGPGEEQAAQQLARITRWDVDDVRSVMKNGGTIEDAPSHDKPGKKQPKGDNWYEKIWDD